MAATTGVLRAMARLGWAGSLALCRGAGCQAGEPAPAPSSSTLAHTVPASIGPWQYHYTDLINTLTFATEAQAYAHIFDHHEHASVFLLAYRWGEAKDGAYASTREHSIETASWKVFQRCRAQHSIEECDHEPEYVAYSRTRVLGCPAGYSLSKATALAECAVQPGRVPAALADQSLRLTHTR